MPLTARDAHAAAPARTLPMRDRVGVMASDGQNSRQQKHEMHSSVLMRALPAGRVMASCGQCFTQVPQPVHLFAETRGHGRVAPATLPMRRVRPTGR